MWALSSDVAVLPFPNLRYPLVHESREKVLLDETEEYDGNIDLLLIDKLRLSWRCGGTYIDGEGSETEVYGIDAGYSDEEEEEEEDQQADKSDDDILDTGEQEEEYDGSVDEKKMRFSWWYSDMVFIDRAWGRNRKLYYNADQGRNLDEMKEEETEALRIQKERIATMDEADFMDNDVPGWGLRARDVSLPTSWKLLRMTYSFLV